MLDRMEVLGVIVVLGIAGLVFAILRASRISKEEAEEASAFVRHVQKMLDKWTTDRDADGMATFSLKEIDASQYGIRLVRDEQLYGAVDAKRFAFKRDGNFTIGAVRLSVPVVKGIRVQAFRGRVHTPKSWTEEEQGRLYLTNRAVIFDGPTRNVRTTLGQIFKYDWSPNGITIEPQRGAIQRYEFEVPPSFAAALLVIMSSDTIKESPSKPEKRVSEPEPSTRPEPESFDDAVGTDARGVKIYEIE